MNGISEIIGGIDTASSTIMTGGREYVVGENSKWSLRQKYIMLDNAPPGMSDKKLAKIAGLVVPLSFNKKIYYDDSKHKPRQRDAASREYEKKILREVKKKLGQSPKDIINNSVKIYDIKRPFIWALGDLLKLIATFIKKHKPNMRKIKVSPNIGTVITQIKKNDKFFKYDHKTGSNIIEVIGETLDTLGKSRIPQGMWRPPRLINPIYPKLDNARMQKLIAAEKSKLSTRSTLRERLLVILNVERILIDHINEIEQFYVSLAGDINKIAKSLKDFLGKN